MIANKAVDLNVLQAQAAALGGTHVGHSIAAYGSNPNYDLHCAGSDGAIIELCQTGQTALANYSPATTTQVTAGAGAGTGAPAPELLPGDPRMSTDVRGVVACGSGSAPTPDLNGHYELVKITFGTPYPMDPPGVLIQRIGSPALALGNITASIPTATGFSILCDVVPLANQALGTYRFSYALA